MEYRIHTLQTNPRHREEEPQNTNSSQDIRKAIRAKQLAVSLFLVKIIAKLERTQTLKQHTLID